MTLDRDDETPQETAEHGILSDAGSVDTSSIGILGAGTAQFQVSLPSESDDDLDDDADVIGDELPIEEVATGDIILEDLPAALPESAEARDDVHVAIHDVEEEAADDDDTSAAAASLLENDASADGYPLEQSTGDAVAQDAPEFEDAPVHEESSPEAHEAEGWVEDAAPEAQATAEATSDEESEEPEAGVETEEPGAGMDAEPAAEAPVEAPAPRETPAIVRTPAPAAAAFVAAAATAMTAAAAVSVAKAASAAPSSAPTAPAQPTPAASPATAAIPTTRREAHNTGSHPRIDRVSDVERVRAGEPELVLASKRLGEFEQGRESSDLLTADRLLDPGQRTRPEPEGLWQQLVYTLSGHRINLGDGRKARARKALDHRIGATLPGGARFVPVLSRKGGVGKTTVTALLGMALADARDDRVIAVDANPDRGTLADRIARTSGRTVRDLVRARGEVTGYNDISALVARDETRLDVLSSDSDPRVSEAFNDHDYRDVAVLAAHYYSLVLTDTGTGIVHSVMGATLDLADQIVVVAGLSVDEARLASETLTWLETNGYAEHVRKAVVVLNNSRPGAPLVRESELEAHFRTRVRAVIRVPYDASIATGSAIVFRDLQPATRNAARELAASVVEGLRAVVQAA